MRIDLAFTAYNRVNYLQESIASWNQVRWLSDWKAEFYIEPSPVVPHVLDAIADLETSVEVHLNPARLGVLVNPWTALDDRFSDGAEFVVMAEDDIVVSQDAIEFLEWSAKTYQLDESVLAINLFSKVGGGKSGDVLREPRFSPLVWGTWTDRWNRYLRDTWDKNYSSGKPDGSEAGWDWNINRILADKHMNIIKPRQSRSDHIGKYAGTHMTPDLFDSSRGVDFKQVRSWQSYVEVVL